MSKSKEEWMNEDVTIGYTYRYQNESQIFQGTVVSNRNAIVKDDDGTKGMAQKHVGYDDVIILSSGIN